MEKRLRAIRKENGMTQEEFGSCIGVSASMVRKYESGDNIPATSTIMIICDRFHISRKWLETGEGEMKTEAPADTLERLGREMGLNAGAMLLVKAICRAFKVLGERETLEMLKELDDGISELLLNNAAKEVIQIAPNDGKSSAQSAD